MSYNTDLQQNNAELQDILTMVNALPEAGSGEVEITLQEKSVTPTKSAQEVTADSGYDGLSKVNVEAIPAEYIVPSGTKNITANGTHDVTANASVSVNVPVPDGYIIPNGTKSITANGEHDVTSFAKASVNVPIPDGYVKPSGTLNITENGTYNVTEKASVEVSVDTEPTLQSKTVTPSASDKTVTADSGYDGLSAVTIKGDANLVADNIKSGVSIFGVSGTYEGSGGGSSTVETCTLTISDDGDYDVTVIYTKANFTAQSVTISPGGSVSGIPKNSIVMWYSYIAHVYDVVEGTFEEIASVSDFYGTKEGCAVIIQSNLTLGYE